MLWFDLPCEICTAVDFYFVNYLPHRQRYTFCNDNNRRNEKVLYDKPRTCGFDYDSLSRLEKIPSSFRISKSQCLTIVRH